MRKFTSLLLTAVLLAAMLCAFSVPASAGKLPTNGLVIKPVNTSETLTIVDISVDAGNNRVLLKVRAETTADVDAVSVNPLNITVKKGAEVTVRIERAESPQGPWTTIPGIEGNATIEKTEGNIEVKLNGDLPAQGYFRAKIVELSDGTGSTLSEGSMTIIVGVACLAVGFLVVMFIFKKKKTAVVSGAENTEEVK